jgi:hypothetical protein
MSLTKVSSAVLNVDDLYGFRNRIINGDMRIDQRNAGASVAGSVNTTFAVDRFTTNYSIGIGATLAVQQVTDAPVGFVNSYKLTVTTGGTATGTDGAALWQHIEGTNVSDLAWGTASASAVTLSFWVKSSLTGTFGGGLMNSGFSRSYPFTYSISSADTWEYKTVTIPGDTTGTWLTTTGRGLIISFSWGSGSDRLGTAGAWVGARAQGSTGQTNITSTTGATWQITGVQLEAGSVATPFERRPFGTELALCQRYFYKTYNIDVAVGTSTGVGMMYLETLADGTLSRLKSFNPRLPVTMRANPTVSAYSQTGTLNRISIYSNSASTLTVSSISDIGNNSLVSYLQASTNAVAAQTYACHMTASAEL